MSFRKSENNFQVEKTGVELFPKYNFDALSLRYVAAIKTNSSIGMRLTLKLTSNKHYQSSTFSFSLPVNVVWDCNFEDFDHVSDEVVVIEEVVIGFVLDEGTKVWTITGDETAVGVISVLTTGMVPTDVVTTGGANINDVTKGEIKEDETTIEGGFDIAVNFNDNSSKIFWAWAWAMASVWVWFCMRVKLSVWARASVWTLARVWA